MTELFIAGVRKAFGARLILSDVDLSVGSGALLAVLGPSGGGKTTLLRLICGFERLDAGAIRVGGALVADARAHLPPEKRRIGYVAQDGALFPHLSVADNIAFGLPRSERRDARRIDQLLDLVGLPTRYASRPPQELSGGEQQRVSLARALAPKPGLILLDEPFSSLDAGLRVETRMAIAAALRQSGATAVLVTHDQGEALSIGDRVAVLLHGRIVQADRPETVYRRPASLAVAQFVGEANLVSGRASGRRVACMLGSLDLAEAAEDDLVDVMIRPEQIRFVAPEPGSAIGTIVELTFFGHEALVKLQINESAGADRTILARAPGHAPLRIGQRVGLGVDGPVVGFPRPLAD